MLIEARVTKIWKNQKALLVVLLLGFSGAFLFDGLIRYPRKNEQIRVYKEIDGEKNPEKWEAYCREKGWSTEVDSEHLEKGYSELEQFIFAGITGVLGLVALAFWLTQKGRVLRMDDESVTSPAGTNVPFSAITGVDSKKWKAKGIARVSYSLEGKHGAFVLDDYKFERKATDAIYDEIEKRLGAKSGSQESPEVR